MKAFFGKCRPISRDLEIFKVSRIVGGMKVHIVLGLRLGRFNGISTLQYDTI